MRVPLDWLAEKFTAPLDRSALDTALFESGFELEAMSWVQPGLETVVTGRIVSCAKHPDADRLRVCQVDTSAADLQIVTAAPNVQAGDIVPVALVGSKLPTGKEIGLGKLRGFESHGMFCSATELGMSLDRESDGERLERIEVLKAAARGVELDDPAKAQARQDAFQNVLVLPHDTPLGLPISTVLELGDCVLEIAVPANRGDGLSVTGLARALAAAGLGTLKPVQSPARSGSAAEGSPTDRDRDPAICITLADPELCLRYGAQEVRGVRVAPSPAWLARRLELAGIRSIHNVVDVTNYVMLDVGQPLHAFDLAKIDPATLAVRRAHLGERIRTLDEVDRALSDPMLVVTDASGPLAIAGVMGGAASAVSESTVDVLLESAYFQPGSVRKTARALGLPSESSYRFERGVDPLATMQALDQAAALLVEIAGGALGARSEAGEPLAPQVVPLRPERTRQVLGCQVEPDHQAALLQRLGFAEVTGRANYAQAIEAFHLAAGKHKFAQPGRYQAARWFEVPGWRRHDVTREIDLIEEIAQRHGYAAIPDTLPRLDRLARAGRSVVNRLRTLLQGAGFWEVLTNSVVPAHSQEGWLAPDESLIQLANPLGDLQVMRSSMVPSLLEVARTNFNRQADRVLVYDAGLTYTELGGARVERSQVAALAIGAVAEGMWKHPPDSLLADFFWAKEIAQQALSLLGLPRMVAIPCPGVPGWHPGRVARYEHQGVTLATFGELHPEIANRYDLPAQYRMTAVLLEVQALQSALATLGPRKFEPFSRYPSSGRDLALVVDQSVAAQDVVRSVQGSGASLLEAVRIFDRYQGPQVPAGKVSLAFNLCYRAQDRTLTDEEVDAQHARIVDALCRQFGASLRV